MKEWLTAKEIAAEKLPDVASTIRGVLDMAEREGWNSDDFYARKRQGRGGGMEYNISLLPLLARVAYQQKHVRVGIVDLPPAANDTPVAPGQKLTEKAALERDARLAIVKRFDQFRTGVTVLQASALQLFTDRYNHRVFHVEPWVLAIVPTLTKPSLLRWVSKKKKGMSLAVDRAAARKGKGVIDIANDGRVRDFVLLLLADHPHLSAKQIQTQCRDRFGDTLDIRSNGVSKTIAMPPVRTFQHALKALKTENKVILTKESNPDLFRSVMKAAGVGTLRHIQTPNQLWQIDASPVDALCTDGRKTVYVCVDIATRRGIFYVSDTPRAVAVGLLLRKAIRAWGAPEKIKTDNGSDFTAKATSRLFAALGIEAEKSDAYSPEQKGHIERLIGTFQHQFAPLLPGFIGHSVADRKAIESRKSFAKRLGASEADTFGVALTGVQLQTLIDEWVAVDYSHAPHGGLKGQTPFQVAAAAKHTIRRVDERALDILLLPVAGKDGLRTARKFGLLIDKYYYSNGSILPGHQVFVRRDPSDLGRVHAFDARDGRYIGEALCAELAGIDGATHTTAQKELQAEALAPLQASIARTRREVAKDKRSLIERALEVKRRDVPNVLALPRPNIDHSTPDIAAALEAATQGERKHRAEPLSAKAAALHAQMLADAAAKAEAPSAPVASVTPIRRHETPQLRFRRALELDRRIEAGETPEVDELLWLGGYKQGSEYRAHKKLFDDFGGRISL